MPISRLDLYAAAALQGHMAVVAAINEPRDVANVTAADLADWSWDTAEAMEAERARRLKDKRNANLEG